MPFLFYDWTFLDMRNLEENVLFSTLFLGSVFSDYVVFYGDPSIGILYPRQNLEKHPFIPPEFTPICQLILHILYKFHLTIRRSAEILDHFCSSVDNLITASVVYSASGCRRTTQ